MNDFQFTNPYASDELVAVYAQNSFNFINFDAIAAGVSLDVYMLMVLTCCLIIVLYVATRDTRGKLTF
jgi:hypothetical protein